MDNPALKKVLRALGTKSPLPDRKISPSVARKTLQEVGRIILNSVPASRRERIIGEIQSLYERSQAGMSALVLHREITRIAEMANGIDVVARSTEQAVARLERQLRDLGTLVTSPDEIEKRFRQLQGQLETLREEITESQTVVAEKQEDMLQKFVSADKKAFIIMPFQRDFDNVWLGGIKPACADARYVPLRVDEVNLSSLITDDIEQYSTMADVVIVDLTGNNPNVMFELGWSLAKNKKPIVICQGEHASKVAFDVRGIRHISYENSWLGIEQLKNKLKEFIATTEQHGKRKALKKKRSKSSGATNKSK